MTLNDQIFGIVRTRGPEAGLAFLNSLGGGQDEIERRTLAHWRASLLARKGEYSQALAVLNATDADFNCRSALAFQRAELLDKLGLGSDAISAIRAAPIADEAELYPGLAWEAAYFGCYLCKKQGLPLPRDWLDMIPDDFETRIDNKPVNKGFLTQASGPAA